MEKSDVIFTPQEALLYKGLIKQLSEANSYREIKMYQNKLENLREKGKIRALTKELKR
ncbi:hypothetical protein SAMN05444673_2817 [Bacillus sp. OV166]|uniref:hypothetical protein n=1 Tax=Bacillus sp. OV166 TaxID=1882763 RepID=UPI000A2ABAB4|nr:hypothetical protein [Bacillus sp. OV166]SMQ77489.1 hypothetical protein SAMN05444673_2817 [Bacillus sp. OV166]